MPSQDGLPAKFRKGLRRSVPSPLPPEQVDWAFRLAEIDINSKIYEKPPLWVYGKTAGDLETRRAVELMDTVRNKRIQLWEFAQLKESRAGRCRGELQISCLECWRCWHLWC
jgi:hypothetical protein